MPGFISSRIRLAGWGLFAGIYSCSPANDVHAVGKFAEKGPVAMIPQMRITAGPSLALSQPWLRAPAPRAANSYAALSEMTDLHVFFDGIDPPRADKNQADISQEPLYGDWSDFYPQGLVESGQGNDAFEGRSLGGVFLRVRRDETGLIFVARREPEGWNERVRPLSMAEQSGLERRLAGFVRSLPDESPQFEGYRDFWGFLRGKVPVDFRNFALSDAVQTAEGAARFTGRIADGSAVTVETRDWDLFFAWIKSGDSRLPEIGRLMTASETALLWRKLKEYQVAKTLKPEGYGEIIGKMDQNLAFHSRYIRIFFAPRVSQAQKDRFLRPYLFKGLSIFEGFDNVEADLVLQVPEGIWSLDVAWRMLNEDQSGLLAEVHPLFAGSRGR